MLAVIAAIAAVAGSASPALASRPPEARGLAAGQLTAQIRYTTGGIPHILAHNWADLGFGYGYAFARDNICTMAGGYITVEAQRSRYFGPDGSYIGPGGLENNLESDFYFQQIIDSHIVQHLEQGLNPAQKQSFLETPQDHLLTRPGIRPAQAKIIRQDHQERTRAARLSSGRPVPLVSRASDLPFSG